MTGAGGLGAAFRRVAIAGEERLDLQVARGHVPPDFRQRLLRHAEGNVYRTYLIDGHEGRILVGPDHVSGMYRQAAGPAGQRRPDAAVFQLDRGVLHCCPVGGHRGQGMEGSITVRGAAATTPDEPTTTDEGSDYRY